MKYYKYLLIFLAFMTYACSASKTARSPKREVPMAINIKVEHNASINFINTHYFSLQLIQDLDQFQAVDFVLAHEDESPEVTLDIDISNFTLWPRDERVARRRISRNIVVGKDASGKPVYQTVTAFVDIVQVRRRANARFVTSLNIKGKPGLNFQRTFMPNYNYVDTYVENLQGDSRALPPGMNMRGIAIEPMEDDFLLILARREMIRRLSTELRKYYDSQTKAVNAQKEKESANKEF